MFWKKLGFVFLILFFICGPLTTIGQQPAMAKETKLIMATYIPPQAYKDLTLMLTSFPDYVNKHGKGIAQIEYFHSGTLLKAEESLPGLMQGTADIILHTDSYIMSTLPILGILELPLLYTDEYISHEKLKIGSPLYNLMNQELAKKNIFMVAVPGVIPEYIWTNKPVRKPDDLKGLRIRTAGRVEAMVLKTLGGASTTLPSAELYEALARGTVDGTMCYLGTVSARNLQEKLKYMNRTYFASYSGGIFIRLDKWNSLPPEVRNLFIEAGKVYEKTVIKHTLPYWENNLWPLIWKAGIKEVKLTKEEQQEFKKRLEPVYDWWKGLLPPGVGEKAIKLATE